MRAKLEMLGVHATSDCVDADNLRQFVTYISGVAGQRPSY